MQVWVQRSCCCAKALLRQSPKPLLWKKLPFIWWKCFWHTQDSSCRPVSMEALSFGSVHLPGAHPAAPSPWYPLWFPCPFWGFRVFLHWQREGSHSWERFSHLWTLPPSALKEISCASKIPLAPNRRNKNAFKDLFRQSHPTSLHPSALCIYRESKSSFHRKHIVFPKN